MIFAVLWLFIFTTSNFQVFCAENNIRKINNFRDDRGRTLEMTWKNNELVYCNFNNATESRLPPIHAFEKISNKMMQDLIMQCSNLLLRRKPRSFYIFSGTKYCGQGNVSAHLFDLGEEEEVDKCCRLHDRCEESVLIGETKYGVKNPGPYTMSLCRCDFIFRRCLIRVNSKIADAVGRLFFAFNSGCFKQTYPTEECKRRYTIGSVSFCAEYKYNTNLPRKYQLFHVKPYFHKAE